MYWVFPLRCDGCAWVVGFGLWGLGFWVLGVLGFRVLVSGCGAQGSEAGRRCYWLESSLKVRTQTRDGSTASSLRSSSTSRKSTSHRGRGSGSGRGRSRDRTRGRGRIRCRSWLHAGSSRRLSNQTKICEVLQATA